MTVEEAGRRVERALDRLTSAGDRATTSAAEELVRVLMDFYGDGLSRVVTLLTRHGGPDALEPLLDDEVLSGLLVLHDLHPQDVTARIGRALRGAGDGSARIAGFEESSGRLRIALAAQDGCGCPSGTAAVRKRIEAAVSCFAPEVSSVAFEEAAGREREPVLLQIGRRPVGAP